MASGTSPPEDDEPFTTKPDNLEWYADPNGVTCYLFSLTICWPICMVSSYTSTRKKTEEAFPCRTRSKSSKMAPVRSSRRAPEGGNLLGEFEPGGYMSIDRMIIGGRLHQPIIKRPPQGRHRGSTASWSTRPRSAVRVAFLPHPPGTRVSFRLLGVIGKDATIFQPRESFEFGQTLLDAGQAVGRQAPAPCSRAGCRSAASASRPR